MNPSLLFFSPRTQIYGVGVEVGGGPGGPRDRRPRPRGGACRGSKSDSRKGVGMERQDLSYVKMYT